MRKHKGFKLAKNQILLGAALWFFSIPLFAAGELRALPGSVAPGRFSSQINPQGPVQPNPLPPALKKTEEQQAAGSLGAEAKKIKFKLTNIVLEDNHVYTDAQLRPLFKDKLNTTISVADLQEIVQSITNYYRNSGYIISRAILPPQHVKNGVVHVRILEGYLDKVSVVGKPRGARKIIQAYGQHIADSKPLKVNTMEKYLLMANEIPGAIVKAVLEPSKTKTAASDLDLSTDSRNWSGYFSYDTYGTRYVGPQELTTGIEGDSLFRSGDATRFTYATTSKGNELQYKDLQHDTPLGTNGLRLILDANQAITNPLFVLQPIQIAGNALTYTGTLRYPVIRSRSQNLTLEGGFYYLDSYVTEFDQQLYTDHVRSLKFGGAWDFADRFKGANLLAANLEQGVNALGATTNNQSAFTSRYGATSVFTKVTAGVSRVQQITGRYSAYGIVKGQYSFQPLLSAEQFGFGGAQMGRGYDPAEIIGDRGAGGTLELRMDFSPGNKVIQTAQLYAFYDAGEIWNLRNVIQGVSTKQSAISTGFGVRFYIVKYVSGNIMFAQPLTRQIQSLELIGNGKCPRVLFNLTASV